MSAIIQFGRKTLNNATDRVCQGLKSPRIDFVVKRVSQFVNQNEGLVIDAVDYLAFTTSFLMTHDEEGSRLLNSALCFATVLSAIIKRTPPPLQPSSDGKPGRYPLGYILVTHACEVVSASALINLPRKFVSTKVCAVASGAFAFILKHKDPQLKDYIYISSSLSLTYAGSAMRGTLGGLIGMAMNWTAPSVVEGVYSGSMRVGKFVSSFFRKNPSSKVD